MKILSLITVIICLFIYTPKAWTMENAYLKIITKYWSMGGVYQLIKEIERTYPTPTKEDIDSNPLENHFSSAAISWGRSLFPRIPTKKKSQKKICSARYDLCKKENDSYKCPKCQKLFTKDDHYKQPTRTRFLYHIKVSEECRKHLVSIPLPKSERSKKRKRTSQFDQYQPQLKKKIKTK